jgi:hypothetical protein
MRLHHELRWLLVPVALVAAVGCAQILGTSGYDADLSPDSGSGSSGGVDASMDTAMVVDSGSEADTGSLGDGPGFIDACVASNIVQAKLERITKACVMLWGCDPYVPNETLSNCISIDVPEAYLYYGCSLTASSCADIIACRGYGYPTMADCPASGPHCNGNRAANCTGAGTGNVTDCTVTGGTCAMYTSAGTTYAGCDVVPGCGQTDGLPHCNGNTLYTCFGDAGIGKNCFTAETCKTAGTTTSCYANLPACSTPGAACAGNDIQDCFTNGTEATFACSHVGLGCQSAACVAPGCTVANETSCTESCSGTVMSLCIGGAPFAVDCAKYGFSHCAAFNPAGGITTHYVECVP